MCRTVIIPVIHRFCVLFTVLTGFVPFYGDYVGVRTSLFSEKQPE